jgi:hypothetical protein
MRCVGPFGVIVYLLFIPAPLFAVLHSMSAIATSETTPSDHEEAEKPNQKTNRAADYGPILSRCELRERGPQPREESDGSGEKTQSSQCLAGDDRGIGEPPNRRVRNGPTGEARARDGVHAQHVL